MTRWTAEPGRICISKMGRDSGRCFVIKEIVDESYVLITDGTLRKVDAPKRKKLKHLDLKAEVIESLAAKFREGTKVFDGEIKSALRETGYFKRED